MAVDVPTIEIFDPAIGVKIPEIGSGVGVLTDTCYVRSHKLCGGIAITEADHLFRGAVVDCICSCHW